MIRASSTQRALTLACCFGALAACSDATPLNIANHSGRDLVDVMASGSGFSHHIDKLPANTTIDVPIHPRGESGLKLSFRADGRRFDFPEQGYFEAGGNYTVNVVIGPDFKPKVEGELKY